MPALSYEVNHDDFEAKKNTAQILANTTNDTVYIVLQTDNGGFHITPADEFLPDETRVIERVLFPIPAEVE